MSFLDGRWLCIMDKTSIYDVRELRQELILVTIEEVVQALKYKGYNPMSQIVGYLMTGDAGYITSFLDARAKICKFERGEVLMAFVNFYLKSL